MQGPISSLRNILIHNNIFELYCRTKGPARCRMATLGWAQESWSATLSLHHQPIRSENVSHSVSSDSFVTPWTVVHQVRCSWNFPGKINGVGCHFLHQGIILTRGLTQVSCTAGGFCTIWAQSEESLHKVEENKDSEPSPNDQLWLTSPFFLYKLSW